MRTDPAQPGAKHEGVGVPWRGSAALDLLPRDVDQGLGLPLSLLSAALFTGAISVGHGELIGLAIGFGSAPLLSAAYVALAALCTRSRVLALMAPAGRMSLTGYLGESMEIGAKLWLTGYRYGPFERVLRAWSYGQRPPLRLPAPSAR